MIDLEGLERLAKEATPGPWKMVDARAFPEDEDFEISNSQYCICYGTSEADASYITAVCNAVPELIQRIRKLEAEADLLADRLACCHCGSNVKHWRQWARERREEREKILGGPQCR